MNLLIRYKFMLCWACLPVAGCAHNGPLQQLDCCAEIPAGFVPEPAGAKICDWQTAQIAGAAEDLRVLYISDFKGQTAQLAPGAKRRMMRYLASNGGQMGAWVVEPSQQPVLDNARLNSVANALAENGSAAEVVLGIPAAHGLYGPFAERAAIGLSGAGGRAGSNRSGLSSSGALGTGFGGMQGGF